MAATAGQVVIDTNEQYLAFFSTGGGQHAPRKYEFETPAARVVRSDAESDKHTYIKYLRGRWPEVCRSIFAISSQGHSQWHLHWFFDEYDFHIQGGKFLHDVVSTMQKENEDAVREFVKCWSVCNESRYATFAASVEELTVDTAFGEADIRLHPHEFLATSLRLIKSKYRGAMQQFNDDMLLNAQRILAVQDASARGDFQTLAKLGVPFPSFQPQNQIYPPRRTSEAHIPMPTDQGARHPGQDLFGGSKVKQKRQMSFPSTRNVLDASDHDKVIASVRGGRIRSDSLEFDNNARPQHTTVQANGTLNDALEIKRVVELDSRLPNRLTVLADYIGDDVMYLREVHVARIPMKEVTQKNLFDALSELVSVDRVAIYPMKSQSGNHSADLGNGFAVLDSLEDVKKLVKLKGFTCGSTWLRADVPMKFWRTGLEGAEYSVPDTSRNPYWYDSNGPRKYAVPASREHRSSSTSSHEHQRQAGYSPQDARSSLDLSDVIVSTPVRFVQQPVHVPEAKQTVRTSPKKKRATMESIVEEHEQRSAATAEADAETIEASHNVLSGEAIQKERPETEPENGIAPTARTDEVSATEYPKQDPTLEVPPTKTIAKKKPNKKKGTPKKAKAFASPDNIAGDTATGGQHIDEQSAITAAITAAQIQSNDAVTLVSSELGQEADHEGLNKADRHDQSHTSPDIVKEQPVEYEPKSTPVQSAYALVEATHADESRGSVPVPFSTIESSTSVAANDKAAPFAISYELVTEEGSKTVPITPSPESGKPVPVSLLGLGVSLGVAAEADYPTTLTGPSSPMSPGPGADSLFSSAMISQQSLTPLTIPTTPVERPKSSQEVRDLTDWTKEVKSIEAGIRKLAGPQQTQCTERLDAIRQDILTLEETYLQNNDKANNARKTARKTQAKKVKQALGAHQDKVLELYTLHNDVHKACADQHAMEQEKIRQASAYPSHNRGTAVTTFSEKSNPLQWPAISNRSAPEILTQYGYQQHFVPPQITSVDDLPTINDIRRCIDKERGLSSPSPLSNRTSASGSSIESKTAVRDTTVQETVVKDRSTTSPTSHTAPAHSLVSEPKKQTWASIAKKPMEGKMIPALPKIATKPKLDKKKQAEREIVDSAEWRVHGADWSQNGGFRKGG